MVNYVLASKSPRRKELLSLLLDHFVVKPPRIEEKRLSGETPADFVLRTAAEKAAAVAEDLPELPGQEWVVVAADTVVLDEGEFLGKPADKAEAEKTLQRLSGRTHQAVTGLMVALPDSSIVEESLIRTDVTMRTFEEQEIQEYIASGDPMDKAGAYAIQNKEFNPVPDFQGCYANVMGLPLCQLAAVLDTLGLPRETGLPVSCQQSLDYRCQIFEHYLARKEGALR